MGKRILVIEDDDDILEILDILFGDEGYEPIFYKTITSLAHIRILHPDLILLDVRILGSEKSGTEICAEIKTESELNDVPVLLLSAEDDIQVLARGCGANGYINKPFDIDKLLKTVKEFLS